MKEKTSGMTNKEMIRQIIRDSKQIITFLSKDYMKVSLSFRLPAIRRSIRSISQEIYDSKIINETPQKISTNICIIPEEYIREIKQKIWSFMKDIKKLSLDNEFNGIEGQGSRLIQRMFPQNYYPELSSKLESFRKEITELFREKVIKAREELYELAEKTVYGELGESWFEERIKSEREEGNWKEVERLEGEREKRRIILNEMRRKIEDICAEQRVNEVFKYSFSLFNGPPVESEDVLVDKLTNSEELLKSLFETEIGIIKSLLKITNGFNEALSQAKVRNKLSLKTRKESLESFRLLIGNIIENVKDDSHSFMRQRLSGIKSGLDTIINKIKEIDEFKKKENSFLKKSNLNINYKQLRNHLEELKDIIKNEYKSYIDNIEEYIEEREEEELEIESKEGEGELLEITEPLELHFNNILLLTREYQNWLKSKRLHETKGEKLQTDIEEEIYFISDKYCDWLNWLREQNKTNEEIDIKISDKLACEELESIYESIKNLASKTLINPDSLREFLEKVNGIFDKKNYYRPTDEKRYSRRKQESKNEDIQKAAEKAGIRLRVSNEHLKAARLEGIRKIEKFENILKVLLAEYRKHKEKEEKRQEDEGDVFQRLMDTPLKDYIF